MDTNKEITQNRTEIVVKYCVWIHHFVIQSQARLKVFFNISVPVIASVNIFLTPGFFE